MGKLFTLVSDGPCGGDMTSRFKVYFDKKTTVQEFVDAVKDNSKEWGGISIRNKKGATLLNIGYRYGVLPELKRLEPEIRKYAEYTITKATANGGWSNMDYVLTVKK